uniref:Uncharacterized protein n=1 Tax=Tanacetum cinerariifolium TaxID=118510 RepID=A0A6L2NC39_TANCI|nr:hypothetical protein [Tanacetum cinerariifolium]
MTRWLYTSCLRMIISKGEAEMGQAEMGLKCVRFRAEIEVTFGCCSRECAWMLKWVRMGLNWGLRWVRFGSEMGMKWVCFGAEMGVRMGQFWG